MFIVAITAIQICAIHVLLNFPATTEFTETWFPQNNFGIVEILADMLEISFMNMKSPSDIESLPFAEGIPKINGVPVDEALPPLCIVLSGLAKDNVDVRKILKDRFLPDSM